MLAARAPRVRVIDALHAAPDFGIEPAAHLLAALSGEYPEKAIFLAMVDPGVGGRRGAIMVEADGRRFVGPDNGLLSVLWQRARRRKCWQICWRPQRLSASFHGRDLFAPVAAAAAARRIPRGWLEARKAPAVRLRAEDLRRIIYIDHYGNAATGLRAAKHSHNTKFWVKKRSLSYAHTFEDAKGPFWYENSMGLVEIAVPWGSAAQQLRLKIGSPVVFRK